MNVNGNDHCTSILDIVLLLTLGTYSLHYRSTYLFLVYYNSYLFISLPIIYEADIDPKLLSISRDDHNSFLL